MSITIPFSPTAFALGHTSYDLSESYTDSGWPSRLDLEANPPYNFLCTLGTDFLQSMDWTINTALESFSRELSEEPIPKSEPALEDLEDLVILDKDPLTTAGVEKECFVVDSPPPEIVVEAPTPGPLEAQIPKVDEADIKTEAAGAVIEYAPSPEPGLISETPSPLSTPPQRLSSLESETPTEACLPSGDEETGLIPPPKRKRGRPRNTDVFRIPYAKPPLSASPSASIRARTKAYGADDDLEYECDGDGDSRAPAKRRRVGKRNDNVKCTLCPKRFTRYADMHRHWTSQHSSTKEGCQCSHCGQILSRPDARKRHERTCGGPTD